MADVAFAIPLIIYGKELSVRPFVTEGQRKRFDLETPAAVSRAMVRRKLELGDPCERQSWHQLRAQTLASWTDCTKKQATMDTYM